MIKDLTVSNIERQNILNNSYAVSKVQEHLQISGPIWYGETVFTKAQVAQLFEVDERTIERYLSTHGRELEKNGYRLIKGPELKELKLTDINVGRSTQALGLFNFRSVLNLAMLLTESERARFMRSRILDIVIDVIAEKTGGHTKYINQRDENYLLSAFQEQKYRKKFTTALYKYAQNFPYKYATFTDRVYKSIFKEKADEYRKILKLPWHENVRDTMYAEVLVLISSYENGLASAIEKRFKENGNKKLSYKELKDVFVEFEMDTTFEPLLLDVRSKMASRDLCFRDALHENLEHYIHSISQTDFDRFLGEKSRALEKRIAETKEVFKRLKDR